MQTHVIDTYELGWKRSYAAYDFAGELCPAPRLAIVGSRAAFRTAVEAIRPVVAACREQGWSVVSGGAYGVDMAAHRFAAADGCPQLVILPGGADRIYPPDHALEFEEIAGLSGSGVLFAQRRRREFSRGMFASRNRLILHAAQATLVVQAQSRSGSLSTGRKSLQLGIPTAVFSGSKGCLQLAAEGAYLFDLESEGMNLQRRLSRWLQQVAAGEQPKALQVEWPAELQWLRGFFCDSDSEGITLDMMGDDSMKAMIALTEAMDEGLVDELTPGRYVLRSS